MNFHPIYLRDIFAQGEPPNQSRKWRLFSMCLSSEDQSQGSPRTKRRAGSYLWNSYRSDGFQSVAWAMFDRTCDVL